MDEVRPRGRQTQLLEEFNIQPDSLELGAFIRRPTKPQSSYKAWSRDRHNHLLLCFSRCITVMMRNDSKRSQTTFSYTQPSYILPTLYFLIS